MKRLFFCFILYFISFTPCLGETIFSQRKEVQAFIQHMFIRHQFDQKKLAQWFDQVRIRSNIIKKMEAPAEIKPWYLYRTIFLTPNRIEKGVIFWKKNRFALQNAQARYGVPPEIIVAIIGIETYYGSLKGQYPVFDVLSTLAFDYPKRSAYFKKELEEFLLLVREQNWDIKKILGSYAGAMGMGQFMPSAYRQYAVKVSQSGKIDLFENKGDSIVSVANYLYAQGWKEKNLIALPAKTKTPPPSTLLTLDKRSVRFNTMTIKEFEKQGIYTKYEPLSVKQTHAILFKVESAPHQFEYWFGLHNFKVLMTYNISQLYALSVVQLSEAIRSAYRSDPPL